MSHTIRYPRPTWFALCLLVATACVPGITQAEPAQIQELRIGFDNKHKVGHWTPLWITIAAGDENLKGQLEIIVPDSDGMQTQITSEGEGSEIQIAANRQLTTLRYVKIGRLRTSVTVRLRKDNRVVLERKFARAEFPAAAPSTQELIVTIGGDIGVDQVLRQRRRMSADASETISCRVESADHLPDEWIGYESVDTLVLATSQYKLIQQLKPRQINAIESWVQLGGRLILCAGANGEQIVGPDGMFEKMSPGKFERVAAATKIVSSFAYYRSLESFTNTSEGLDKIAGIDQLRVTTLRDVRGRIEPRDTKDNELGPAIVHSAYGFGQVTFVAVDLDQPPFAKWQGRSRMVALILREESQQHSERGRQQQSGKVSHEGYDDMVGQLRTAMDQFNGVTPVSFTAVAMLTVLYILVIGPGDYFLLKKLLIRMEWTWVTFPISVVLFCVVAYWLVYLCKSRDLSVNQVELIEVDAASSMVRGTMWAHVYSPATEQYDFSFEPRPPSKSEISGVVLSWQGLPGEGLGAMGYRSVTELSGRPYSIISGRSDGGGLRTMLGGVPIQVSSSKTLNARWWGRAVEPIESRLVTNRRDNSLRGQFTNPLDEELSDCVLSYGNWAYRLNRRLAPHETINVLDQMSERSLHLHLTRRSADEDKNKPWDQASADVPRIIEIMMHYRAARGRDYTGLSNRYQAFIDMTEHLQLDRAILVGRTGKRAGELARDGKPLADDYDQQWTFYRVVFPVEEYKR